MKSLICALVPLLVVACGNGSNNGSPDMAMPATTLGTPPPLAITCSDALADVYTLPSGLPAMDMSHRGDVFRCSPTESMTAAKVNSQINAYNADTFGNKYTTRRQRGLGLLDLSRRLPQLAQHAQGRRHAGRRRQRRDPRHPRASDRGAPLVVFAHGRWHRAQVRAVESRPVGHGAGSGLPGEHHATRRLRLTVIAPDYAGYSFGQTAGYFNAEDEGHSVLDATRAAAKLLTTPPDKVVLVGHSQGGHAVLSAQSYQKAYGMQGTLAESPRSRR